jgi:hypothetical protein
MKIFRPWKRPASTIMTAESYILVSWRAGSKNASSCGLPAGWRWQPVVIPSRYNFADTSGISITAAADSNPVTIAIEKQ